MTHNIETVDTRPENILEVRDLKKYFLINKEWKLKKAAGPAPALPETGDAELGPQGGIAAVGQLQLLQPFFGLALAGWLLQETVQPMMIAVMAGVVVCVFGAKRFSR